METRTQSASTMTSDELKDASVGGTLQVLPDPSKPAAMIAAALRTGRFEIDELERLYELQRQYDKDEAKKAFHLAKADFKRSPPDIVRDMLNKQYNSTYASIAAVVNTTNAALAPHGLDAHWDITEQTKEGMKVACILTHAQGHSERVEMWGPMDTSGQKNPLQQVNSTFTYLKIGTFEAVTGVASRVGNADDDGNGNATKETEEQRAARESAEKKETDWRNKISAAKSVSEYEGLRVDLLAAYGGSSTKVPKPLRDFCVEKKALLSAQESAK
jgi:ERF superfamily